MMLKLKEIQERIERFLLRKTIILLSIFMVGCYMVYDAASDIIQSNKEVVRATDKMTQSYVAIDTLGRLANLPRTFVTPEKSQERIADALKLLLVDKNEITNKFKVEAFKDANNILDSSSSLKEFYFNYIQIHNGMNDSNQKLKEQGVSSMVAYLENILQLFQGLKGENLQVTKELPYYISISKNAKDTEIKKFELLENNHFMIEVNYLTTIFKYDGVDTNNKIIWKPYTATSKIFAKGYMDIQTQNLDKSDAEEGIRGKNFDGLHFYQFNVVMGL